jgi:hypothetical protein
MPLGAWLDIVRPLVGWPVVVAEGVDLSRTVPLCDFHVAASGLELVFELDNRTPYDVRWTDTGITIRP